MCLGIRSLCLDFQSDKHSAIIASSSSNISSLLTTDTPWPLGDVVVHSNYHGGSTWVRGHALCAEWVNIDANDQGLIFLLVQRKFVVSKTSDYVACAANLRVGLESNIGIVCLIDLINSLQILI